MKKTICTALWIFCISSLLSAQENISKIISFPENKSLGILSIRDSGIGGRKSWEGWKELGQARGNISIPNNKEIRLEISDNNYENLAGLASLKSNDIKVLSIYCRNLQDSDLVYLKELTGLESLVLSSGISRYTCPLNGEGFVNLNGMTSLKKLLLQFTKVNDENLVFLKSLNSLNELTIMNDNEITGEGLVYLKDLPSLRTLSFYSVPIDDVGLENLKGMDQLEYLNLQYTNITEKGLSHLGGLRGLKMLVLPPEATDDVLSNLQGLVLLEELSISDTKITDDGLKYLKDLTGLKSLDISGRTMTGSGLTYLRNMPQLKQIKLMMMKMNDETMKGLNGLGSVTSLYLGDTKITDAGLANIESLTSLEGLNMKNTLITDAGLMYLKGLKSLNYLILEGTQVTDTGLSNLQNLSYLKTIRLQNTNITDKGLVYLKGLKLLTELYLEGTQISDDGLANLKELNSLKYLSLNNTNVSGEGLVHLKEIKSLRALYLQTRRISKDGLDNLKEMTWLNELTFSSANITEEDMKDIKKALPDCQITVQEQIFPSPKPVPIPDSLAGKTLPELKGLDNKLSAVNINNKNVLICFFDMNQRPSRNCIFELSKKTHELAAKDVVIIAVQASQIEKAKLNKWIKDNNIPLPVGIIEDDIEKIRYTWGVKSLPHLILTDKQHIVRSQGFSFNELEGKLKETTDVEQ